MKMLKFTTLLCIVLLLASCSKQNIDICLHAKNTVNGFKIYEYVLDTCLVTDTAFIEKDILFKANEAYSDMTWSIGSDPRSFNAQSVNLRFSDAEKISVSLKATSKDNNCNWSLFSATKPLVLLQNNGSIVSPLVGSYKGYHTDKPNDTFRIGITYWIGLRYNWWPNGAYTIENLPKGYSDTTKNINGNSVPEIKGIIAANGYKNLAFDKRGDWQSNGIKGYASLNRGAKDTIVVNYQILDTLKFNQTGNITYLQKTFIGIKN